MEPNSLQCADNWYSELLISGEDGRRRPDSRRRADPPRWRRRSPTISVVSQARGSSVARHGARHVLGGHALDRRHELGEIVVGQIVQRQLHRAARDLLARSRSCARSRASARATPSASSSRVIGRAPRIAAISPIDSSIARAVVSRLHARPGARTARACGGTRTRSARRT